MVNHTSAAGTRRLIDVDVGRLDGDGDGLVLPGTDGCIRTCFHDLDELVALANATLSGLSLGIVTRDVLAGLELADHILTGAEVDPEVLVAADLSTARRVEHLPELFVKARDVNWRETRSCSRRRRANRRPKSGRPAAGPGGDRAADRRPRDQHRGDPLTAPHP